MQAWTKLGVALLVAGMAGSALAASPAAAQYAEGRDYHRLAPAIATVPAKGKVDVVEFFWYGCPHCHRLQKPWGQWLEANAKSVSYRPQPAVLGKSWEVMGRAYHAMVGAGGFDASLHGKFFSAIHERNQPIQTLEDNVPKALYAMVAAEKGAAYAKKFQGEYEGFSMGSQIAKDREAQKAYKLEGTPTIVVAGRYSVNPSIAGSEAAMVPIVDFLVRKARAEAGIK